MTMARVICIALSAAAIAACGTSHPPECCEVQCEPTGGTGFVVRCIDGERVVHPELAASCDPATVPAMDRPSLTPFPSCTVDGRAFCGFSMGLPAYFDPPVVTCVPRPDSGR